MPSDVHLNQGEEQASKIPIKVLFYHLFGNACKVDSQCHAFLRVFDFWLVRHDVVNVGSGHLILRTWRFQRITSSRDAELGGNTRVGVKRVERTT